ncbi:MAG: SIMPL domain-containing protein [Candidatus Pacebacteria bacterium]|nr:SIMPL domain-containing protein [Candidatus Paceibacterota bacterium]
MVKKEENNTCCLGFPEACMSRIIKSVILVLVVLALFLLVKTYGALKENSFIGQDIMAQNTITVTGEGEVSAIPDIAKFSFAVKEEAKTVEQAQEKATEKMNAVLDFLDKAGVDDKEIKTTGYNIYPRYEWWNKEVMCEGGYCPPTERQRTLVAYEVSQNISVELKDVDSAGEILAGIGSLEVSNVSGLSFDIDDKDGLEREARQEAIDEAQSKAKELAKDLGVKLVRIVSYSSNDGRNVYPQYAVMEKSMAYGMVDSVSVPEIPVGENEIKTTVYLTYEIK